MNNERFETIVSKLQELTNTGKKHHGQDYDWRYGVHFSPNDSGASLDELREVGKAYGLYLHHCSHCDRWYFAWFQTLEEARRYEESQHETKH